MFVLWIDWWSKMIGLAKTNESDSVVFPVGFLQNDGDVFFALAGIVAEEKIWKIVIGWPKREPKTQEKIQKFAKNIQLFVDIPIEFVDEDYSSVEAGESLSVIQSGNLAYSKTPAKDSVAAMKILERWRGK